MLSDNLSSIAGFFVRLIVLGLLFIFWAFIVFPLPLPGFLNLVNTFVLAAISYVALDLLYRKFFLAE